MTIEHINEQDPRIQAAVAELQGMIAQKYPAATFEVFHGEDPEGTYLRATVDIEDTDEVVDLIIDRLVDLQVEERLPVYVIPVRPLERVIAEMKASKKHRGQAIL